MFLLTAPVWIMQSLITGLCRFIRWFPPEQRQGVNQLLCTLSRRSASLPDQPLSTNICPCLSQTQLDTSAVCHRPRAFAFDHTEIGKVQCVCVCVFVYASVSVCTPRLLIVYIYKVGVGTHQTEWRAVCIGVMLSVSLSCPVWEDSKADEFLKYTPWRVKAENWFAMRRLSFFHYVLHLFHLLLNTIFRHFIHKQNMCCPVCNGLILGILAHLLSTYGKLHLKMSECDCIRWQSIKISGMYFQEG